MDHPASDPTTDRRAMDYCRDVVDRVARRQFPHEDAETILDILDLYGAGPSERERSRIQLAILKLSAGDPDTLLVYVMAARVDWRDVLAWADSPSDHEGQVTAFIDRLLAFDPN